MTVLRGGTVTFVFTDIEGSTELLKRLGDGYADALAEHRRLIRDAFGERGGQEIDTQGDAFFYCFERARDAVAAAVAAQRALTEHEWPDGTALRVRMSLHTGEPVVGDLSSDSPAVRVTTRPAEIAARIAGICATNPSPMVRML